MKEKSIHQLNKRKIFLLFLIAFFIIALIIYFFVKNDYKNSKVGNNMSNKTLEEIEEYILNIGSYEAEIEVTVESNKNKNQYILSQKFTKPNISKQTVIEPKNIAGIETIYDGNTLTIHNTRLNASTIYENYEDIFDNFLWLNEFIEDYQVGKGNGQATIEEENGIIILKTKAKKDDNRYVYQKELYVDRSTGKPTKLIIQDINKNNLVYILYNEITINGLQKEEVLAFKLQKIYDEIY